MITDNVEVNMTLHQLNKCSMIDHLILLTKNLKKRLSKLIVVLLIQHPLMIFNVRFVGTTPLLPRIHFSTVVNVPVQWDIFITSAWSIGWNRRWQRKKKPTWYHTVGNNSNVSFAKNHILMSLDQMVFHIVWSMLSLTFPMRRTIYFLNHLHLRRIVLEWYIL